MHSKCCRNVCYDYDYYWNDELLAFLTQFSPDSLPTSLVTFQFPWWLPHPLLPPWILEFQALHSQSCFLRLSLGCPHPPVVSTTTTCLWLGVAPSNSDPSWALTSTESCLGVSKISEGNMTKAALTTFLRSVHSFIEPELTEHQAELSLLQNNRKHLPISMHCYRLRPGPGLHRLLLLKFNFFQVTAKSMNKKKIKIACNSNSTDNLEMYSLPFFTYTFLHDWEHIIYTILCATYLS